MPALRPASQASPMCNPRKETSLVLRDTITQTDGRQTRSLLNAPAPPRGGGIINHVPLVFFNPKQWLSFTADNTKPKLSKLPIKPAHLQKNKNLIRFLIFTVRKSGVT